MNQFKVKQVIGESNFDNIFNHNKDDFNGQLKIYLQFNETIYLIFI